MNARPTASRFQHEQGALPSSQEMLAALKRCREILQRNRILLVKLIDPEWAGDDRVYIDAHFRMLKLVMDLQEKVGTIAAAC